MLAGDLAAGRAAARRDHQESPSSAVLAAARGAYLPGASAAAGRGHLASSARHSQGEHHPVAAALHHRLAAGAPDPCRVASVATRQ